MDFSHSDEQQAVIELARKILRDAATPQALRALEKSGAPRFDRALWKRLAEAGLLGAAIPENYGGGELGFLALAGILEEVGRCVAPAPLLESAVLGALPIAQFGSAAQKERWLPRAARGEAILTAALIEPHREPADPGTRAEASGAKFRLSGEKLAVPAGELADAMLVPAALSGGGVGVFLLDARARGVTQTPLITTSRQPESALALDGAEAELLGRAEQGAEIVAWIVLRATAALCALTAGVTAEALRLTAEYTKTRKQFDQPIATFQAVAQRAADAFIDTEAVRLTALQAAWRIDAGLPAEAAVAAAKVWAAQGGARVVRAAQHLHGGVGVDREYPLHRYYVTARQLELTLGGGTQQLRTLGKLIARGEA
ncbi:MAG TPA: acyl-CoA dehydrogenase family protein [Myxococcota bacterium]|jgi:alkylation response protein AidB-like acyl-CoA dehydrogenase